MKVNMELTVDEFCSIKSCEEEKTIIDGYNFSRLGNKEVTKIENQRIKKGDDRDGFLLQEFPLQIIDGASTINKHIIRVKIVKAHAVENYPPPKRIFKDLFGKKNKNTGS